MFCHACGRQVSINTRFCPNCGQPLPAVPAVSAAVPYQWSARTGIQAQPVRWLGEGWRLVTGDLGNYLLVTLVYGILNCVPFIQGPLIAGFHEVTIRKLAGKRADVGDLFKGFNFFVPALVASLLIGVFTFFASLLFIIPGLVVAAMYKFTYLFIVDKRMDFWPAMQASHAVVRNDYFGFTMFLLLLILVNIAGVLCLLVGVLVTIPVTFAAITIAYHELVGSEPRTADAL